MRTMADGRTETVRWNELSEIAIVTTDQGPFVPDAFWLLHGEQGGCAVPSETDGMGVLLTELQRLPGFDNEAVIRAMGSAENASFLVWRRPPSASQHEGPHHARQVDRRRLGLIRHTASQSTLIARRCDTRRGS